MVSFKVILAPTDFSEIAARAVAYAFELAAVQGGKVHLVHAYQVPPFPDGFALGVDLVAPIEQAARRALGLETEKYASCPAFGGVILEMGDPRDVVLHHAQILPADMIVMGTHGRSGVQRWALGSVAERVVRSARCPVLVVPPERVAKMGSARPLSTNQEMASNQTQENEHVDS